MYIKLYLICVFIASALLFTICNIYIYIYIHINPPGQAPTRRGMGRPARIEHTKR